MGGGPEQTKDITYSFTCKLEKPGNEPFEIYEWHQKDLFILIENFFYGTTIKNCLWTLMLKDMCNFLYDKSKKLKEICLQ